MECESARPIESRRLARETSGLRRAINGVWNQIEFCDGPKELFEGIHEFLPEDLKLSQFKETT